ncbi:MAG: hypothetical protein CV087_02715 [Candidatus Brocadia sp. WS118]|nr:MAG: hypothetical protein CV087_02715 [Candidatus Brocadia sp. WS118]
MSAVDYAILGKSHTPGEYLRALRDTIFTAAATTLGATSVTHPFVAGARSPVSQAEQARQAQETHKTAQTQQAQPSVEIWKVTKTEFVLKDGKYRVRSAYELPEGQLDIKLKKAQDGGRNPIPVEKSLLERDITQGAGVPSDTLHPESSSGTPVASDASSQTPSQKITEKPSSQTSETFPGNLTSNIQQGLEFVKPDIQLMASLKDIVDTNNLSIEDALEIDDVARQNNWSDDTVKQFHKSAVEGLGIQNNETQGLASLLITARIKEAEGISKEIFDRRDRARHGGYAPPTEIKQSG